MVRTVCRALLIVVLVVPAVEIAARVMNGGYLPIIPYTIERGVPVLPARAVFDVRFSDGLPVRYVTDRNGFRVGEAGTTSPQPPGVFVAGDSQVLGYGFEFTDTFASIVAEQAFGGAERAAILGPPAMDPEMLEQALAAHRGVLAGGTPLAVVALNLGNDLDEIFTAGSWYRGIDQPWLQGWLIRNSVAYMTYVQHAYARAADHAMVPGINRMFYMTAPEERVLLARETADLLIRASRALGAQDVIVLIVPQDIQVFPADFGKYRKYFADAGDYARWEERVPEVAAGLRALEAYTASRIEAAGLTVIRLSALMPQDADPALYFSRTSHHLMPASHRLIADAILARLRREGGG